PPFALRDLLDVAGRRRRRDAEQMALTANLRREVEELAVRRPLGVVRLEIPVRGEIDWLAAGDRPDEEILGAAMIQLLLDDHVGPERPRVRQILAVRREPHLAV